MNMLPNRLLTFDEYASTSIVKLLTSSGILLIVEHNVLLIRKNDNTRWEIPKLTYDVGTDSLNNSLDALQKLVGLRINERAIINKYTPEVITYKTSYGNKKYLSVYIAKVKNRYALQMNNLSIDSNVLSDDVNEARFFNYTVAKDIIRQEFKKILLLTEK